jgi:catalase
MDVPVINLDKLKMSSNSNQTNPLQHPVETAKMAVGAASSGVEARAPRASHMASSNEGAADIIGKVSGVVSGGKRKDDGAYFTNKDGIPIPDA